MAVKERLTPTLFDKLVADLELSGLRENEHEAPTVARENFRFYSVPNLQRFNEAALRTTVKRDLVSLLNTTHFEAGIDLEPYPEVATSVLNFGVPDLSGKSLTRRVILQRAREIRRAIQIFEPRLANDSLRVEPSEENELAHAVTFVIEGDMTSASNAFPVKFRTDVDAEVASVDIRD